jgi:hypothetical protein
MERFSCRNIIVLISIAEEQEGLYRVKATANRSIVARARFSAVWCRRNDSEIFPDITPMDQIPS